MYGQFLILYRGTVFRVYYTISRITGHTLSAVITIQRKQKKNADRSAWHITKEQALKAWFISKQHQLARLRLALERVELCVEGVKSQGVLIPGSFVMGEYFPLRVHKTPDTVECGSGPVLSEYSWMEI